MAQAQPVVAGIGFTPVRQVCALTIGDIKKIAQHCHLVALLPLTQQGCNGHVQVLPQQVQQRALNGGNGMYGHPQVKSLKTTTAAVTVCKSHAQSVQYIVPTTQSLSQHQRRGVFECEANFFAAGHLAHACVTVAVCQDDQIASKKWPMGTAQVEQHAVVAGHRNDLHAGDGGGAGGLEHAVEQSVGGER